MLKENININRQVNEKKCQVVQLLTGNLVILK